MSYTKFLIIAQPRTGSTFLQLLLSSHRNIKVYGEIFHQVDKVRERLLKLSHLPMLNLNDDPIKYLENNVYRKYPEDIKAVGFRLFYYHARNIEWKNLREYLRSSNVKVIHLKRENLLDRYLSHQLADRYKEWVTYKKKPCTSLEPLTLNIKDCIKDFHRTIRFQGETDDFFNDNPKYEIIYEDIVDNLVRVSKRLLNFLGVDFKELSAKSIKQQTKKRFEIIANYEDLNKKLIQGVSEGWAKKEWLSFFN
jgi:LPS sulfotransferase NodH